jgi:hypothetical protein
VNSFERLSLEKRVPLGHIDHKEQLRKVFSQDLYSVIQALRGHYGHNPSGSGYTA